MQGDVVKARDSKPFSTKEKIKAKNDVASQSLWWCSYGPLWNPK